MLKTAVRRAKSGVVFSPFMRRIFICSGRMLLMALLARSRLKGELSPFAPACFSAALVQGWHPSYMLAGCALGALSDRFSVMGISTCLSCFLIALMYWIARRMRRSGAAGSRQADGFCVLASLMGVWGPGMLLSGGLTYNMAVASLNALGAAMLAPALVSALGVRRFRRLLMPEEQLSLSLLVLLFLAALCSVPCAGAFLSQTAAVLVTLTASFCGCGRGAMAGIAAGSALALGGSDPFIGSSLCLCGLLAGCVKDTNRLLTCVIFIAGSFLSITWGLGYTLGVLNIAPMLCGCGLYCLIPRRTLLRLRGWMSPRLPRADIERLAVRVRRRAGRKLSEISSVFGELADGCGEEASVSDARRAIPRRAEEAAGDASDVTGHAESRSLMGRQFREAQKLIDSLVTRLGSEICLNEEYALLARSALDRAGIHCSEVLAVLDDRLEFVCVLKEKTWNVRRAQRAARLLSDEIGLPFAPALSHGRVIGECELYLMQVPALSARFASGSRSAEDGAACGDSRMIQLLSDGRLLAVLSDGMGRGEEAARESARCMALLRKFVAAGVERDAVLTAVNQLLLMRGGDEMFATADLCVINLYSGMASFSKLGACRSFVLREGAVREVAGGRLPLGILERVEPSDVRMEVFPGDLLIMFSDGVADELKEGQCDALKAFLPSLDGKTPEEAAARILDWAAERDGDTHGDDKTVIAVRIDVRR